METYTVSLYHYSPQWVSFEFVHEGTGEFFLRHEQGT